jgi:O-methyltransferase
VSASSIGKRLMPQWLKERLRPYLLHRVLHPDLMVLPAELETAYRAALDDLLAHSGGTDVGDYVEFGVAHGTSMICMANTSRAVGLGHMRLIGFDSFEGLPAGVSDEDLGVYKPGDGRAPESATRRNLRRNNVEPARTTLVTGWFDDTATPEVAASLGLNRIGVAMIDCNVYSSARKALQFISPLLADRAVLVFDDWHYSGLAEAGLGEARAYGEMLAEHPELREVGRLPRYHPNAELVILERHG